MHSIKDLQHKLQEALSSLSFQKEPLELYEPIDYTLSLGGKRMRPVLLLMGCDLFGGNLDKAMAPAMGIEVFHNFTLLHDDIMDNAPLRRSQPTVHQKWNPNIAILSGDTMLVEAYKLMMKVDDKYLREVLDIFNSTAIQVCEGQQLDMNYETQTKVTIADYISMITLKTAVLLAASLSLGALVAGAEMADAQRLYNAGMFLGVAFQLQDDILDVYGDESKFGKQVGGDILANKKTYLLLKAFELADAASAAELTAFLTDKSIIPQAKIIGVTAIYDRLGVKELARQEMQAFYQKAMLEMAAIQVAPERKTVLNSFADTLMVREI